MGNGRERERERDLEVHGAGEEEDVQQSGVCESSESTDALERKVLQLFVYSETVTVQGSVPVDREELHPAPCVPLSRSLP